MVVAGLVAAGANLAVLQGGRERVEVMVAARDLRAGEPVTPDRLEARSVPLDGTILEALLVPGDLDGTPMVTATALPAGTPLRDADLRPVVAPAGKRRMSLPVDPARAVGGRIEVGDRVDVIHIVDGVARYVVSGAPVLEVNRPRGPLTLGETDRLSLTITVDTGAALCLARAIEDGSVDVVVSTGQQPIDIPTCMQLAREGS